MCETSVDFRGKTREIRLSLRKHFGLVLRAEISEPIAAARLKAQHARVRVLDGAAFHRLGDDATWGPVVRIGLEAHVALVTPHRWHIGAIGHDATRLGPVVALDESAACVVEGNELLDGCRMHGREARKRAKIEEISQRRVEMHDEGVRVRRFDGDVLGEIRLGHAPKFSRIAVIGFGRFGIRRQRSRAVVVERARAADGEVKRGVVGSGIGQNRAAPRVGEVRARHGITVGPPGIRAQMKGVGAQVSGDFPPFCHALHNRTVAGAQIHQRLVDHARAAQLMLVTHALRVERVAVRSLDQHQVRRRQRRIKRHRREPRKDQQENRGKQSHPPRIAVAPHPRSPPKHRNRDHHRSTNRDHHRSTNRDHHRSTRGSRRSGARSNRRRPLKYEAPAQTL